MTGSVQLTSRQSAEFRRNGYLLVPQLFDAESIALLDKIARADRAIAAAGAMEDADGGKSKIWITHELHKNIYTAFVHCERIVQPMEQIFEGPVYHWHHKMILKEPRIGGAWEWHQDYGYWYIETCLFPRLASCLIAVDRAVKENGCLQVLKGSHKMGRLDHQRIRGQFTAEPQRVEIAGQRLGLVHCEMEPGDALFFHCNTLHRSDPNRSESARWSLICCYNAIDNIPFRGEGHPDPVPLDAWPTSRITEIGRHQWQAIQAAAD